MGRAWSSGNPTPREGAGAEPQPDSRPPRASSSQLPVQMAAAPARGSAGSVRVPREVRLFPLGEGESSACAGPTPTSAGGAFPPLPPGTALGCNGRPRAGPSRGPATRGQLTWWRQSRATRARGRAPRSALTPAAWPGASHPPSLSLRSRLSSVERGNSGTGPLRLSEFNNAAHFKRSLRLAQASSRQWRQGHEAQDRSRGGRAVCAGQWGRRARPGPVRPDLEGPQPGRSVSPHNGASICFRGTRGYPPTLCPHVFNSKGGWRGRGATGIAKAPHTAESRAAWAPRPCRPQGRPPPARGPARPRASAEHRAKPRHRAA